MSVNVSMNGSRTSRLTKNAQSNPGRMLGLTACKLIPRRLNAKYASPVTSYKNPGCAWLLLVQPAANSADGVAVWFAIMATRKTKAWKIVLKPKKSWSQRAPPMIMSTSVTSPTASTTRSNFQTSQLKLKIPTPPSRQPQAGRQRQTLRRSNSDATNAKRALWQAGMKNPVCCQTPLWSPVRPTAEFSIRKSKAPRA